MPDFDIVFRNARLIDGSGGPSRHGDLGVTGDRIAAIGALRGQTAAWEVDARGLALAPGFIDSHCHDDRAVIDMPLLEPKVSQGVTTVINGNCGVSIAPFLPGLSEPPPPLNIMNARARALYRLFPVFQGAGGNACGGEQRLPVRSFQSAPRGDGSAGPRRHPDGNRAYVHPAG